MTCPLCGEHCTCSYAPPPAERGQGRVSVLIDPDDYDTSEQQFEASLASPPSAHHLLEAHEQRQVESAWKLAPDEASVPPARYKETNPVDETPRWREEVASRLESYRARRKRPPREGSLSLDFERAVNRAVTSSQSTLANEAPVANLQSSGGGSECPQESPNSLDVTAAASDVDVVPGDAGLTTDDHFVPDDRRLTSDGSNVIEFPRPPLVITPPSGEELAEPIIDKPRILDAPETVETAQAPLAGIELEPEEADAPAVEFELPLVVAGMSRRAFAGLIDMLVVGLANAVFLMVVLRGGATLPPGKTGALLLMAAPILFWAVYEYMFLVHGGGTPGMRAARLQLVNFEGRPVSRRLRRGRALAMVLSCLSLGLGLLWALLDEDTLCWHDRISRTYLVSRWSYRPQESQE